ncbi:DUF4174 domain-containing protein [Balneolaceae bacterium YR4-1]|uniref:DUF4174 domain-containing protein n=1 Tax=Halalkalibaculum roseum TaxID=2709311 RepID=A0A6M1SSH5_9BACT|nr:DUF4174 domain-containing protein [Halalkalibaculum roseum]NGP75810.1 DUF4174 domain-containing protein [Halalkalibaculum roseum]
MLAKILLNATLISLLFPYMMLAQNESEFQLSDYRWENRLLLVFAPSQENDDYQKQLEELNSNREGVLDRDLKIVHLFSDDASNIDGQQIDDKSTEDIYKKYEVTPGQYTVILIGKDGTVKLRTGNLLTNKEVFGLIDSMPMRQREMREQGE